MSAHVVYHILYETSYKHGFLLNTVGSFCTYYKFRIFRD